MKPSFIRKGWKATAIVVSGVMLSTSTLSAQEAKNNENQPKKKSSLFGDTNNAPFPLGGSAELSDNVKGYVGVEGNVVGTFQDSNNGDDESVRSEIYVTLGVDIMRESNGENLQVFEGINIEAGVSFQDILSQATDDDFNEAGSTTYSTGLTNVQARDVINKLRVLAALLTIRGQGETEVKILAQAGRYQVDQIGSFIPKDLLVTESVLTPYALEQQDAVGVAAVIDWNKSSEFGGLTRIDVNFHGNDWFGYTVDALKDVEQDGDGSFAINLLHQIAQEGSRIQFKLSYIQNEDGVYYTRALAGEQPGENKTYAAGIRYDREIKDLGTLILAAEGAYIDREIMDELWMAEAFAALELENLPITPFVDFAYVNDADADTQDWAVTLGAALRVVSGVTLSAGVQFLEQENSNGDDTRIFVGATLAPETPVRTSLMTE